MINGFDIRIGPIIWFIEKEEISIMLMEMKDVTEGKSMRNVVHSFDEGRYEGKSARNVVHSFDEGRYGRKISEKRRS